jgi:hypothetical protein
LITFAIAVHEDKSPAHSFSSTGHSSHLPMFCNGREIAV